MSFNSFTDVPQGLWLRTDEAEDVAGSIRHCIASYDLAAADPQAWKWVILAMHSALQGACVCHLTTTFVPVGSVTDRNADEWIAWSEERRVNPDAIQPKTYLADLPTLLKRARKPFSAGDGRNTFGIRITSSELAWLTRLHRDARNQFMHFSPTSWSLGLAGIPGLTALAVRVIREIQLIGWAFRNQDQAWQMGFQDALSQMDLKATRSPMLGSP